MPVAIEKSPVGFTLPAAPVNPACGLLHGKAGISLVYYLLSKHTGDRALAETGLQLLNELAGEMETIQHLDFGDGLAGVGWCIEWLVQENLLTDTNTDEVLEDVDDLLYKSVLHGRERSVSLLSGLAGKLAYFLKRYASSNEGYDYVRKLYQLECLVVLTDDIAAKLFDENGIFRWEGLYPDAGNNNDGRAAVELGSMLYHFSGIKGLNTMVVENVLYGAVACIEAFFDELLDDRDTLAALPGGDYCTNVLFLAASYEAVARVVNHAWWQQRAIRYIEALQRLFEQRPSLQTGAEPFRKLTVYALLRLAVPQNPVFEKTLLCLLSECREKSLPDQLAEGWGLITLCQLSLEAPQLVDCWGDILIVK